MRVRPWVVLVVAVAVGSAPALTAQGAPAPRLDGLVGAGDAFRISLRNADGTKVRKLRAGTYRVRVRDASKIHNFRLRGAGVSQKTGIGEVVTRTWVVTFKPGVYTYLCTPHGAAMGGTFRVVA